MFHGLRVLKMTDTIRIDNLPSTILPSRDHEFPSMKDGIAVKLSVGQILDLLIGTAPETLDTLQEIAAWVTNHETEAAAIVTSFANKLNLNGDNIGANSAAFRAALDLLSSSEVLKPSDDGIWFGSDETVVTGSPTGVNVTGWPSDAKEVEISFNKVQPSSDGQNLRVRYSSDGVTFENDLYHYSLLRTNPSIADVGGSGQSEMVLSGSVGNGSDETCSGAIRLFNPGINSLCHASMNTICIDQSGSMVHCTGGGWRVANAPVTSLRFFFNTGNVTEMRYSMRYIK